MARKNERLAAIRKAVRPQMYGRMSLTGPAGSGKTRTALDIAETLAGDGQILGIDTERESMLTYADDYEFLHLPWEPPFAPAELAQTLREIGDEYAVVIIDSLSHFWNKEGGTLEISGGRYTGWKEARAEQEALVDAILGAKAHVILCIRAKMKHEQLQDSDGRHVVRKLGVGPIQDETLEYELNVALDVGMSHELYVSKSRTAAIPVGTVYRPGRALDFAEKYRDWLAAAEPPAPAAVIAELRERIGNLPPATRKACKAEFKLALGLPDHLTAPKVDQAVALVARYEAEAAAAPASSTEADEPDGAADDTAVELRARFAALPGDMKPAVRHKLQDVGLWPIPDTVTSEAASAIETILASAQQPGAA